MENIKSIKLKMSDGKIRFLKSDNICSSCLVPIPGENIGIVCSEKSLKGMEVPLNAEKSIKC